MLPLVEPHLAALTPYVPGKPIEETEREYGIQGIAKLASNENCLGPSPLALEAASRALQALHLYPDADGFYLKQRLAKLHAAHAVEPAQIVLGNGTNELLTLLVRAFVGPGEAVLNAWPSFVVYRLATRAAGRVEVSVPVAEDLGYDLDAMAAAIERSEHPIKLVFLANPNNPTGRYFGEDALARFITQIPPDVIVVLDEAYAEYVTAEDYPDGMSWVAKRPRFVVTRTFSKIYGLAASRVGYAVCDPQIADILNRLRDPFNVNSVGYAAAMAALDDSAHVERARTHNAMELPKLTAGLERLGLRVTPSVANFVLVHVDERLPPIPTLNTELLKRGVIIRPVANYGLTQSARITVGTTAENERLLGALQEILSLTPRGVE